MSRIKVKLSTLDEICVREVAAARNLKEGMYPGTVYPGKTPESAFEVHVRGLRAEFAVARHYGVEPDLRIHKYTGDNGNDLHIAGYTVGVKSTTYLRRPYLRVEKDRKIVSDLYMCTVVQDFTSPVWLIGWAWKAEVLEGEQKKFGAHLPMNYVLYEWQLKRCRRAR